VCFFNFYLEKKMKPIARKDDLVIQELAGEILVYDLRTNKAICLNRTSALVWQNCDGKKDTFEIAGNLEKEFGTPVKEELIRFAINQLKEEELLENKEGFTDYFRGMSRREVVKKIGLGSMVAIPVVASLVTPLAVQAQTCIIGGTCTCNAPSGGMQNEICPAAIPCVGPSAGCRCAWANSGNANGTCVP
jgi:hypothetical protein